MKDLRPPVRPAYRRQPARDDAGEVLKVVIVALLLVVALMFAYQYGKPKPPVEVGPAASLPEPAPPPPAPAVAAPQPRYEDARPTVPAGPSASEWSRLESLRDYCQRMTRMNAGGEYPSLQRSACGDYARYAQTHGFGAVALPEVLELVPGPSRPATAWATEQAPARTPPPGCAALEREKESINARTRGFHSGQEAEWYRQELRRINARMWDLNCRNH